MQQNPDYVGTWFYHDLLTERSLPCKFVIFSKDKLYVDVNGVAKIEGRLGKSLADFVIRYSKGSVCDPNIAIKHNAKLDKDTFNGRYSFFADGRWQDGPFSMEPYTPRHKVGSLIQILSKTA